MEPVFFGYERKVLDLEAKGIAWKLPINAVQKISGTLKAWKNEWHSICLS